MLAPKGEVLLKSTERDAMRLAGRFNASVLDHVRPHVKAGMTTGQLDEIIHDYTVANGHIPACLGYKGFPKSCCTSVNEVICHGIPGSYVLKSGDIVNVDVTTIVDGWHGDCSETFLIGECDDKAKTLTQCAFDALYLAIEAITPGCVVARIGETIVAEAKRKRFSVVREYVGHGLGQKFHQDPSIPHFPSTESRHDLLLPGMCFTIEPMINAGSRYTKEDRRDGWTVRTRDGKFSAQFEHTILMTEEGPEILTPSQNGPQPGHRFV